MRNRSHHRLRLSLGGECYATCHSPVETRGDTLQLTVTSYHLAEGMAQKLEVVGVPAESATEMLGEEVKVGCGGRGQSASAKDLPMLGTQVHRTMAPTVPSHHFGAGPGRHERMVRRDMGTRMAQEGHKCDQEDALGDVLYWVRSLLGHSTEAESARVREVGEKLSCGTLAVGGVVVPADRGGSRSRNLRGWAQPEGSDSVLPLADSLNAKDRGRDPSQRVSGAEPSVWEQCSPRG